MDGKPPVVNIVRLVAEQVEHLGVHDSDNKVERIVGIADDDEQCRLLISEGIKLQLVVAHQLPQLCDVEG